MPLQSLAQRTVSLFPCRNWRPSDVDPRGLNGDFTAETEASACRHRCLESQARWPLPASRPQLRDRIETLRVSSSKTHTGSRGPTPHRRPKTMALCQTPLLRFIEGPLRRLCPVRPLPEPEGSFAVKVPPFTCVPPLPSLTTSAVCSARRLAGLLHPATGHGVRLVLPRYQIRKHGVEAPPERSTLRSVSLPDSAVTVTDQRPFTRSRSPLVVAPVPGRRVATMTHPVRSTSGV
jgi:hypothetical protein